MLLISGWLVAIPIVVVCVVPSVVLPAQCALLGAMGGALYGMWRLGTEITSGDPPGWRELIVPGVQPVLSAVAGWGGLMGLSLILRILTDEEVGILPETAWSVSLVLGILTDPICGWFRRGRTSAPSFQNEENGYNGPSP
ncbi:MAG: hypothetical protein Q4C47_05750 [Planctomycetia bacterium]|nr:hypothetical protein [Planctomycetia bacterium]